MAKRRRTEESFISTGVADSVENSLSEGIGARMMAKMGYRGGGLGKNEQGSVAPIESKLRPRNMGLGFGDKEPEPPRNPPQAAEFQRPRCLNRGSGRSRRRRRVSWDLETEVEYEPPIVREVLDMRNSQVRTLTDLRGLNSGSYNEIDENINQRNSCHMKTGSVISRLFDNTEFEMKKFGTELRNETENVFVLQREKEKLQQKASRQKNELQNFEEILHALDQIEEGLLCGVLNLHCLAELFMVLRSQYRNEYEFFDLASIAANYARHQFVKEFQGWDPLKNPRRGLQEVSLWKDLLEGDGIFSSYHSSSVYGKLFWETLFPVLRRSCTNSWQARDPEPLIKFLNSWEHVLPCPVVHSILNDIVLPKLLDAVNSWDPCQETLPVHQWVHPWLPLLGDKLQSYYPMICNKIETALRAWHPSDISAQCILLPWKTVLAPPKWEQLMARSIIPKLFEAIRSFQINPADQKLDEFHWVLTWASDIPIDHMLRLMDIFFDKWQEVLYQWLCTNPDFEEVSKWYLGWKELLPPELSANEHVRHRINVGLNMMNQAVEGMEVVHPGLTGHFGLRERNKKQVETLEKFVAESAKHASVKVGVGNQLKGIHDAVEVSLKEVVQAYALQNGLLFKPKPGRIQDGYQVYSFGNVNIILDSLNEKILARTKEGWSLVSLEHLVRLQDHSV